MFEQKKNDLLPIHFKLNANLTSVAKLWTQIEDGMCKVELFGVIRNFTANQSINVYSFHQPYLIFQEKKAYSVATLYQNISKVTDYYISVEKISNRNCLEEELLEVLPKAKGAVASNVEGVEPGSC